MKIKLLFIMLLSFFYIKAQVGIGTNNPNATLDIKGNPTNVNVIDGLIPPRITKSQLASKTYGPNGYNSNQNGSFVYVTDVTLPVGATEINQIKEITNEGLYFFNGTIWKGISTTLTGLTYFESTGNQSLTSGVADQIITFTANDHVISHFVELGTDSQFKILNSGFYRVTGFVGLNPSTDLLTANSYIVFNFKLQKQVNASGSWTDVTGIRSVFQGRESQTVNSIEIPAAIVSLNKNDLLRLVIQYQPLTINNISTTALATGSGINHIGRHNLLSFSKSITIQKY